MELTRHGTGGGIHLSESGVNGFPIKELSNGGALQLQWKGFYGDAEYTYSSVLPVKEMLSV